MQSFKLGSTKGYIPLLHPKCLFKIEKISIILKPILLFKSSLLWIIRWYYFLFQQNIIGAIINISFGGDGRVNIEEKRWCILRCKKIVTSVGMGEKVAKNDYILYGRPLSSSALGASLSWVPVGMQIISSRNKWLTWRSWHKLRLLCPRFLEHLL